MKFKNKTCSIKKFMMGSIRLIYTILICLLFQQCNEEHIDPYLANQDRFISITDLNNPETLMKTENVKDYLIAFKRFTNYASVKNERIIWNINSGAAINVSEDLFNYISKSLEKINQKVSNSDGKLTVFIKNGEIQIFRLTKHGLIRLKSGDEGDEGDEGDDDITGVDFGASSQQVGVAMIDAFNYAATNNYTTGELFNISSGSFSINDMTASGTFSMGGYTYSWGFTDITAGGTNNISNDICTNDREIYGSTTYDMLRYCSGNSAATITSYSSAAASYIANFIP